MRVIEYVRSTRNEGSEPRERDEEKRKPLDSLVRGVVALLLLGVVQPFVALLLALLFAFVGVGWPTFPGSFSDDIVVNAAVLAVGLPVYWLGARAGGDGTTQSVLRLTLLFAAVLFSAQAFESLVYFLTGEPKYGLSFSDVPASPLLLVGIVVVGLGLPFLALAGYHGWRSIRE